MIGGWERAKDGDSYCQLLAVSRKTMERELGGSMTRVEWRELCLHSQQEMAEWVADESHFVAMGFFKKRAAQSDEAGWLKRGKSDEHC